MDRIAERLVGKELRQIHRKSKYDAVLVFEDGSITAWTEVKVNVSLGNNPLIVQEVKRSEQWYTIVLTQGDIRISRVAIWPSVECFIYGAANDPTLTIIDRGEE
jgi:hypothetical protein